ncbi:TRAP transporter large permease [Arcobacter peruensis]|uniref:TRAP transporter large permease n=1 Tax=Arcobacter peruensis TaxID=2320140 RepID=UPI000F076122|nr:TRAP transporter large permease subunit [Arcobacter peruensis]
MEINDYLVISMFVSFLVFLFSGIPVAWVLGGVGVAFVGVGYLSDIYLDTITGLDYNTIGLVANRIYKIMDNWILVALPMFIFMGLALDESGIAEKLLKSLQRFFGKMRGGLAITVVILGILLAASTGIIGASVVLLAVMSLPMMLKQGYDKQTALGVIASSGTLGILIPPSIMLIIMADQLSISVGDLFMGALFPGILLGVLYMGYIFIMGLLKPNKMPIDKETEDEKLDFAIAFDLLKSIIPPAALVLAVLGSIFFGLATPTEASGIGAAGALFLMAMNGQFNFEKLKNISYSTMNTTGYIFAIFVGATCFSLVLRELGGDELISSALHAISEDPIIIILFILALVFILGFVLDWIEITLIILPLVGPIVMDLAIDIQSYGIENATLVWFVLLVAMTLQTSFLTPPVGFALFYLKGVCPPEVKLSDIYKGVIPFIILQLIGLAIVFFFPQIVTWLPSVAY